jgi:MFS transporter, Spinster family, sphingosine-1-phosphate transporter
VLKSPVAILSILTALNLINYLDRYLVVGVGKGLSKELHLDYEQFAVVTTAFMWGYFVTSPIFGWLGDRYPRKWLIAAGVAVWSIATAVSGLAASYGSMLAARVIVGIGEASYATLSPTIIDDLASPSKRNRWLAIFYVAIPVGSALGFVIGGLLEKRFGWRSAFFLAGGPGILLSFLVLLVHEPVRTSPAERARAPQRAAYVELMRLPRYVYTVLGYVGQTFALGGFAAFAVKFLQEKFPAYEDDATLAFGAILVVTGLGGTAFGGWLADRLPGKDRLSVNLRICAWSSLLGAPLALAALLAPSAGVYLVTLAACELFIFTSTSPTNAAVLGAVPPGLRANAMALSIFAIHALGDIVSPPLVGRIGVRLGQGVSGLEKGMYLLPVALLLSALAWFRGASLEEDGVKPRGTA